MLLSTLAVSILYAVSSSSVSTIRSKLHANISEQASLIASAYLVEIIDLVNSFFVLITILLSLISTGLQSVNHVFMAVGVSLSERI